MTTEAGIAMLARSVLLFIAAGLCEIGGGYLMWLWWRDGRAGPVGAFGAAIRCVASDGRSRLHVAASIAERQHT